MSSVTLTQTVTPTTNSSQIDRATAQLRDSAPLRQRSARALSASSSVSGTSSTYPPYSFYEATFNKLLDIALVFNRKIWNDPLSEQIFAWIDRVITEVEDFNETTHPETLQKTYKQLLTILLDKILIHQFDKARLVKPLLNKDGRVFEQWMVDDLANFVPPNSPLKSPIDGTPLDCKPHELASVILKEAQARMAALSPPKPASSATSPKIHTLFTLSGKHTPEEITSELAKLAKNKDLTSMLAKMKLYTDLGKAIDEIENIQKQSAMTKEATKELRKDQVDPKIKETLDTLTNNFETFSVTTKADITRIKDDQKTERALLHTRIDDLSEDLEKEKTTTSNLETEVSTLKKQNSSLGASLSYAHSEIQALRNRGGGGDCIIL